MSCPCTRPVAVLSHPHWYWSLNSRCAHDPWECFSAEPEGGSTALRAAAPYLCAIRHQVHGSHWLPCARPRDTKRHPHGPVPSKENDKQTHSADLILPGLETTPVHMARVTQSPNTHAPPPSHASGSPSRQARGHGHPLASPPSPVPPASPRHACRPEHQPTKLAGVGAEVEGEGYLRVPGSWG